MPAPQPNRAESQHFAMGPEVPDSIGAIWRPDGAVVVDNYTPRDALMAQEGAEEVTDRSGIFIQTMGYLFGAGPHPAHVLHRTFVAAATLDKGLLRGTSMETLSALQGADAWAHGERVGMVLQGTRVSERPVRLHEREINSALEGAHHRLRAETPRAGLSLDELLGMQEGESFSEYKQRLAVIAGFMRFFFLSGPVPGRVVRRVFCVAKGVTPHLCLNMTLEQIGEMFGEVRATWSWRMKKVLNRFLKICGAGAVKLRFQKSDEACRNYARAQKGNRNRQGGAARVA